MTNICIFYAETLKLRFDKVNFREQVRAVTHWSYTTFYNRMRNGNLREWEIEKITPIVEQFKPTTV